VKVISQGEIVAASLKDYLQRHPEIEQKLAKNKKHTFFTTDSVSEFDRKAEALFFGKAVRSEQAVIDT
jgi:glutamate racemase